MDLHWSSRSAGLTAQLQALRKALYHKYVQEVAALKEQHNRELKRLREESEQKWRREECHRDRGEKEQDSNGDYGSGRSIESDGEAGQVKLGRTQDWERVEEEVAKVERLCIFSFYIFVTVDNCIKFDLCRKT